MRHHSNDAIDSLYSMAGSYQKYGQWSGAAFRAFVRNAEKCIFEAEQIYVQTLREGEEDDARGKTPPGPKPSTWKFQGAFAPMSTRSTTLESRR